jgi:hypothetical protein
VLLVGALLGFFKTRHLIESGAYKADVPPGFSSER